MASFSAAEAIGSGFQLIRREPRTMLIWIAAYAVFAALMYGLMFAAMPELLGYYQEIGRSALQGVEPDEAQAMAMASRMLGLMPVLALLGLAAYSVMLGAVYRARLHPDDRRFGYLRFGRSELWLAVTMVVWSILMLVIYLGVAVVLGGVAGIAGGLGGDNSAGFLVPFFIAVCLGVLLMLAIMMRLSLALPMSHDQRRLVIFESWRITRGRTLKMLGVGVAIVVMVWVIELAVLGVLFGLLVGSVGGLEALASAPSGQLADKLVLWIPVFAILAAVFGVLMFVIMATPIADIYRQLKAPDDPATA